MNSCGNMEKKGGVEAVGAANNENVIQPKRQQSRTNLKLLKRSHAITESTSPPPDVYEVPTPEINIPESVNINNNNLNKNKNDPPESNNWPGNNRENQVEKPTSSGLEKFITNILHKSSKDRHFLMKIEQDLTDFTIDEKKTFISFGIMSSYERMLVHRVAQYFGLDHNVDSTGHCVLVSKGRHTQLPSTKFREFLREEDNPGLVEPRRSILKRDSASFDELVKSSDRHTADALRRSKSYEEREEEYEKARRRIFQEEEASKVEDSQEGTRQWVEHMWPLEGNGFSKEQPQASSSSDEEAMPNRSMTDEKASLSHLRPPRLMKGESYETKDTLKANSLRSSISKSYSFGGYDQNANARVLTKQDSGSSMSSRVSPLSSGYKSQSLRSDTISATPSPSVTPHYNVPMPHQSGAPSEEEPTVLWAVTKMESVPAGSILINPQNGEPFTNQDGSIYHFDPSNPPNLEVGSRTKHHERRSAPQPEVIEPRQKVESPSPVHKYRTSQAQAALIDPQPQTLPYCRPAVPLRPFQVESAPDLRSSIRSMNLNEPRRQQFYRQATPNQIAHLPVQQSAGGMGMVFNTPPPSFAQPPPPFPYRYGQTHTANVSVPELNFPPPPSVSAYYQYPPNMQVVTPNYYASMASRIPNNGMMGLAQQIPSAPSPMVHHHMPLPNAPPHPPQNPGPQFQMFNNPPPPMQGHPQFQAGCLPRPPMIRGPHMQGPWSWKSDLAPQQTR